MPRFLLLALAVACAPRATPEPAPATDPSDADLAAVVKRLSVQHPSEDCAALTEGLAQPTVALRRAVEEVATPPWVGIIAGKCMVRRYAVEAESTLAGWLVDPELAGLSRVLSRELAGVSDEAVAIRLATSALRGPAKDVATEALRADPRPALQALVAP